MMERTRLSDEEIASSGAHVGGGDNQGLIIKKKAPEGTSSLVRLPHFCSVTV
jgi:hypothetical protein